MKRTLLLSISLCLGMTAMAQSTIKVSQISNGGEPMIFLPHIGCSSEMWEEIAEYYENEYACYLIDLAGFNGINPIDSSYTENFVKDIQAFLYNNQLDNAILLGQNYGAFLGVKVAQNKQLKVKAIIASDFYPNLSMVLDTAMTKEKLRYFQKTIRTSIVQPNDSTFQKKQELLAKGMNFIDTTYVKQFVDWKTRSDRQTMAETLCEQLEENLLPSLENNSIQMLVFSTWYFAKTYKNMPLSDAKKVISKMYGNTPLITHAITENAKDFIANDQPEWFTNEVNTFLKNR